MLERLRRAAATIRPKAVAQLAARVTRLASEQQTLSLWIEDQFRTSSDRMAAVERQVENQQNASATWRDKKDACSVEMSTLGSQLCQVQATLGTLTTSVVTLNSQLGGVARRCDQLLVARERLASDADMAHAIDRVLDVSRVRTHVSAVLNRSPLAMDPFPHVVIDDLLPRRLYSAIIDTMPPRIVFEDNPVNKQQLRVPPYMTGSAAFRLWRFLVADVVEDQLRQALVDKFQIPLAELVRRFWPTIDLNDMRFNGSDGRIILRRRGYVIPPHRDSKWGWLTFILYLAKPGDPDTWGTQLYRVSDDEEAPGAQPFWM